MRTSESQDNERLVVDAAALADMDDSALSYAVRRFHQESAESHDPIAAFGAFNQHSSSPW